MMKKSYLLLVLLISTFKSYDFSCDNLDELEGNFLEVMFFGSPKAIVPANDGEMKQHCDLIHHGLDGIKAWAESCTKGFPHEAMKVLIKSMKEHMEKRCDNPKDKAEFIEYVGCLLPKDQKMGPLNVCSEKHLKMISLAVDMGEKGHIHGACCSFFFFKHCILDGIQSTCGDGHRQFWDEIFEDVASEAVTFACEGFNSKEKCASDFNPEYFNQLQAIDTASDPAVWAHHHKTPLPFVLEMIKKYHGGR